MSPLVVSTSEHTQVIVVNYIEDLYHNCTLLKSRLKGSGTGKFHAGVLVGRSLVPRAGGWV